MKNFKYLILLLVTCVIFSCDEQNIMSLEADGAANFEFKSEIYSFTKNEENTYLYEAPILIMGNVSDHDRVVEIEAVADSITTAPEDLYEIHKGIIKANESEGIVSILLKNAPVLDTKTVSLKIRILDSEDILAGNEEAIEHVVSWNNQIKMPKRWWYFTYFYSRKHSPACLKIISKITGIDDLSNYSLVRVIGAAKVQALAVKFGDYVMQYNLDHPGEPLRHSGNYEGLYGKESGLYEGDEIIPVKYTHSKFD